MIVVIKTIFEWGIKLLTVHPKAISFSTVSSRKKNVKTRFMNVNMSMRSGGASWNYRKHTPTLPLVVVLTNTLYNIGSKIEDHLINQAQVSRTLEIT